MTLRVRTTMHFLPADAEPAQDALVLANTEDPADHAQQVREARAVVLEFPKWTDGRAYSQAVLLRARLKYRGPIVARGEVLVDMLPLLRRCGFDAVQLRADQDPATARRVLSQFDGHYQADVVGGRPWRGHLGHCAA